MSIFESDLQRQYWKKRRDVWDGVKDIEVIPELSHDFFDTRFEVISERDGLDSLLGEAQVIVIAGAYFGDEAKGKWGNALVKEVNVVIRPDSGANTGRTVLYKGKKISLHLVPTALVEGKRSLIGAETVGDPISLEEEELRLLRDLGVNCFLLEVGNFFVTTPYHRIMDVLGSSTNESTGVGITPTHESIKRKTCPRLDDLFAFPEQLKKVLRRDWQRSYVAFVAGKAKVEAAEAWDKNAIVEKLERIQEKKRRVVPDHVLAFAKADDPLEFLVNLYAKDVVNNKFFPQRVDASYEVAQALQRKQKLLVEVTQSILLSNARQQGYCHSTSADVSALGALTAIGVSPVRYKTVVVNVNKFPGSSRVGQGDIPASFVAQNFYAEHGIDSLERLGDACSNFQAIGSAYFNAVGANGILKPVSYTDETGEYEVGQAMAIASARLFDEKGATTGKPRVTGLFDCVLERMVAEEQGPYTVISCMDRGNDCDNVGLVVGYVVHLPQERPREGKFKQDEQSAFIDCNGIKYRSRMIIRPGERVPTSDVLQYCVPIIKVMKGWKDTPLTDLKPGEALPPAVNEVLGAIEHYTGFKVSAIGTGPDTHQALYLRRVT